MKDSFFILFTGLCIGLASGLAQHRSDGEGKLRRAGDYAAQADDPFTQQDAVRHTEVGQSIRPLSLRQAGLARINMIKDTGRSAAHHAFYAIDWRIAKIVLGIAFLVPAMPAACKSALRGVPLSPFILERDMVTWPTWLYDSVHIVAIVGVDLIILGCIEFDWAIAVTAVRIVLVVLYGGVGLASFLYCVMSKNSAFGDEAYGKLGKLETDILTATNRFQDVGTSAVKLTVLMMAILIFMKFYSLNIMMEVPLTPKAYRYFYAAIPMQIIGKSMLGYDFRSEARLWHRLIHSAGVGATLQRGDDRSDEIVKVTYSDCIIRSVMSYYSNNVCIAYLFLTLPVFMLNCAGDIDFVKDCFAVMFITTLDDLSESIPLRLQSGHGTDPQTTS